MILYRSSIIVSISFAAVTACSGNSFISGNTAAKRGNEGTAPKSAAVKGKEASHPVTGSDNPDVTAGSDLEATLATKATELDGSRTVGNSSPQSGGGGSSPCVRQGLTEREYNPAEDEVTYLVSTYWSADVTITVFNDGKPVKLLLRSYGGVNWKIENPGSAEIRAVVVTSYTKSSVSGVAPEIVTNYFAERGIEPYMGYNQGSPELDPRHAKNAEWVNGFATNAGLKVFKGYFSEYLCKVEVKLQKVWPLGL